MQLKSLARWTCALLAVATAPAMAQAQASIEDLARNADLSEVALSPTGEYVALAVPTADNRETLLQIVKIDGSAEPKTFRFQKDAHVGDLVWTADDQVTVARKLRRPLSEKMLDTGELMSTDLTGDKQRTLFAYVPDDGTKRGRNKDEGWAYLRKVLDDEPGKALVSFTCWNCGEDPDAVIFKVDTRTGTRQEVERIKGTGEGVSLFFDHAGIARVYSSVNPDGTPDNKYRPTPTSAWTPLPESIAGFDIDGGVFAEDNNTFYGLVSDHGEANALYKIDMAAGTRTRLFGEEGIDVADIMTAGRKGVPFGVEYNTYKPKIQYFDNNSPYAQLHMALMKRFPGQMVTFLDFTRDDSKILFSAWSDKVAGNYYVIDRANGNKITQVGARTPWLDGKTFASKKPIEFKNRGGETIYGYYTAPIGGGTGPKPLVVMPHGGPYGVRDEWGFESDVQFLASRGYGVLQVNFRGSSGRGNDFVVQAWKQWGGMLQDDITDGVKYAISSNLADPQKVCIYGASYGGYSAMMQPILNPGMYKCAVGYVGVYDLPAWSRSKESLSETGEVWLGRTLGTDMDALAKVSPANRAAEIKVPVMLVHGKSDTNVGMGQYRAMEGALTNIGKTPETFLAPGEGHGFEKPENRAELYRRLGNFLDKYIGPGTQTAGTQ
jgi:dipeptidyl aminopeptidase/acylaminoacyl peptidase